MDSNVKQDSDSSIRIKNAFSLQNQSAKTKPRSILPKCKACTVILQKVDDYLKGKQSVRVQDWVSKVGTCSHQCRTKHIKHVQSLKRRLTNYLKVSFKPSKRRNTKRTLPALVPKPRKTLKPIVSSKSDHSTELTSSVTENFPEDLGKTSADDTTKVDTGKSVKQEYIATVKPTVANVDSVAGSPTFPQQSSSIASSAVPQLSSPIGSSSFSQQSSPMGSSSLPQLSSPISTSLTNQIASSSPTVFSDKNTQNQSMMLVRSADGQNFLVPSSDLLGSTPTQQLSSSPSTDVNKNFANASSTQNQSTIFAPLPGGNNILVQNPTASPKVAAVFAQQASTDTSTVVKKDHGNNTQNSGMILLRLANGTSYLVQNPTASTNVALSSTQEPTSASTSTNASKDLVNVCNSTQNPGMVLMRLADGNNYLIPTPTPAPNMPPVSAQQTSTTYLTNLKKDLTVANTPQSPGMMLMRSADGKNYLVAASTSSFNAVHSSTTIACSTTSVTSNSVKNTDGIVTNAKCSQNQQMLMTQSAKGQRFLLPIVNPSTTEPTSLLSNTKTKKEVKVELQENMEALSNTNTIHTNQTDNCNLQVPDRFISRGQNSKYALTRPIIQNNYSMRNGILETMMKGNTVSKRLKKVFKKNQSNVFNSNISTKYPTLSRAVGHKILQDQNTYIGESSGSSSKTLPVQSVKPQTNIDKAPSKPFTTPVSISSKYEEASGTVLLRPDGKLLFNPPISETENLKLEEFGGKDSKSHTALDFSGEALPQTNNSTPSTKPANPANTMESQVSTTNSLGMSLVQLPSGQLVYIQNPNPSTKQTTSSTSLLNNIQSSQSSGNALGSVQSVFQQQPVNNLLPFGNVQTAMQGLDGTGLSNFQTIHNNNTQSTVNIATLPLYSNNAIPLVQPTGVSNEITENLQTQTNAGLHKLSHSGNATKFLIFDSHNQSVQMSETKQLQTATKNPTLHVANTINTQTVGNPMIIIPPIESGSNMKQSHAIIPSNNVHLSNNTLILNNSTNSTPKPHAAHTNKINATTALVKLADGNFLPIAYPTENQKSTELQTSLNQLTAQVSIPNARPNTEEKEHKQISSQFLQLPDGTMIPIVQNVTETASKPVQPMAVQNNELPTNNTIQMNKNIPQTQPTVNMSSLNEITEPTVMQLPNGQYVLMQPLASTNLINSNAGQPQSKTDNEIPQKVISTNQSSLLNPDSTGSKKGGSMLSRMQQNRAYRKLEQEILPKQSTPDTLICEPALDIANVMQQRVKRKRKPENVTRIDPDEVSAPKRISDIKTEVIDVDEISDDPTYEELKNMKFVMHKNILSRPVLNSNLLDSTIEEKGLRLPDNLLHPKF